MTPPPAPRSVPVLLALALLAGCGTTPPSRFYVLAPDEGPAVDAEGGLAVVLERVRVPPSVDRPQIVTVTDRHERRLAELARWAEPLGENLAAVLAENLAWRLDSGRVSVLPTQLAETPDFRVNVDVVRLDATLGGSCTLVALWSLQAGDGAWLDAGRISCEATAADDDHGALAEAMSRCVADLSDALAAQIRATVGGG